MNHSPLGYTIIEKNDPFLTVYVKGTKLSDVATSGLTRLSITRLGEKFPCASYVALAVDVNASKLVFVLGTAVLDRASGRYVGTLTYKGTLLGDVTFIYCKPDTVLVGA